ncbi:hypothetical protein CAPTEDRAFT_193516 [Capitella teleta]|uniref:Uncharacterized protein n=1 Tax=Capitella teleta TaxID=283909 RepID=R7UD82_CAPTE|nr:hypothetical protein CAPTEDRAFT_193516 [Capitella teleta]|eukprot:ELU04345.1 hypothetical protein CAPTEDRAFT_193516 [Capitella teleta]
MRCMYIMLLCRLFLGRLPTRVSHVCLTFCVCWVTALEESGATQPSRSASYVSPTVIFPVPKAGPRNKPKKGGRKKGTSKVLTSTPVHEEMFTAQSTKESKERKEKQRKGRKQKAPKKALFPKSPPALRLESDSSDSDVEIFYLESDSDFEDDEGEDQIEGDYVIVNVK